MFYRSVTWSSGASLRWFRASPATSSPAGRTSSRPSPSQLRTRTRTSSRSVFSRRLKSSVNFWTTNSSESSTRRLFRWTKQLVRIIKISEQGLSWKICYLKLNKYKKICWVKMYKHIILHEEIKYPKIYFLLLSRIVSNAFPNLPAIPFFQMCQWKLSGKRYLIKNCLKPKSKLLIWKLKSMQKWFWNDKGINKY